MLQSCGAVELQRVGRDWECCAIGWAAHCNWYCRLAGFVCGLDTVVECRSERKAHATRTRLRAYEDADIRSR